MFVAIDPSFRNTGWAIMDRSRVTRVGLIQTFCGPPPVYKDNELALAHLTSELSGAILYARDAYGCWDVHAEAKGGSKSAKAATMMAMSQAITSAVANLSGLDLYLMLPGAVKKSVCGDRRASKSEVREAVIALYPEAKQMIEDEVGRSKARQEHIYDAIAIGLAIDKKRAIDKRRDDG